MKKDSEYFQLPFIQSLLLYEGKHHMKKIKQGLNEEFKSGGNEYERIVREGSKGLLTVLRVEKQGERVFIKIGFAGSKIFIDEIKLEKKQNGKS